MMSLNHPQIPPPLRLIDLIYLRNIIYFKNNRLTTMVYLGKFVKGKAVSLFMRIRCLALDYGSEEDIYQDSSSGQGARRP